MARPKSGTEAGENATAKWRETMLKKYGGEGGLRTKMQSIGRIGGQHSRGGGFAYNPALAVKAGAIGGRISRRGGGNVIATKIEPRAEEIKELYQQGYSVPQISEKLDISYSALLRWFKTEVPEYGRY